MDFTELYTQFLDETDRLLGANTKLSSEDLAARAWTATLARIVELRRLPDKEREVLICMWQIQAATGKKVARGQVALRFQTKGNAKGKAETSLWRTFKRLAEKKLIRLEGKSWRVLVGPPGADPKTQPGSAPKAA